MRRQTTGWRASRAEGEKPKACGRVVAQLTILAVLLMGLAGCKDQKQVSQRLARDHVAALAETVAADVAELRSGMPQGAKHKALVSLLAKEQPREAKAEAARKALEDARDDVQDLRICKATFFAVAGLDGVVIRTDQEVDRMAGKGLFEPFPELRQVLEGKAVETRGDMPEARGVEGKPDGQWIVGQPVKVGDQVKGLYAAGWSWSKYAYRLEFKLRNDIKAGLGEYDKMPLVYVFVVTDKGVHGAPMSPLVTEQELGKLDLVSKLQGDAIFSAPIELTGRGYGVAAKATPALGPKVGVAVLRSET